MQQTTTIASSFHLTTDVPVVAYEINPYGGGSAATTASSLLLPTSAWDTNYVLVNVSPFDVANPSLNIVAAEDGTQVTMVPTAAVVGGGGIPAIALTAFARSEDRTRALHSGFNVHVAKPVEPSELIATVASVAGRTR